MFRLGTFIGLTEYQYSLSSRRSQSPINCIRPSVLGPIKRKGMCVYIIRCFNKDVVLQLDTFLSPIFFVVVL